MPKGSVRNVTNNLGGKRLPRLVSILPGAAMPGVCAWSATITGSMLARRTTIYKMN